MVYKMMAGDRGEAGVHGTVISRRIFDKAEIFTSWKPLLACGRVRYLHGRPDKL